MLTIIKNTFREALAKKIFIGYYIFYAIVILIMIFLVNMDSVEGVMSLTDTSMLVKQVETGFLTISWNLVIFFSLISTASFIPSMLEKGTIDLLISKPISRPMILLSKYIGAVLFVFLSMVFLLGSIWLILSLKSGFWDPKFLLSIVWFTMAFAVMYSIVVVIGLTTQSTVVAILVNFFLIFVLCPLLSVREAVVFSLVSNETVKFVFDFLYYLLPKPGEFRDITNAMIMSEPINMWKSIMNAETGSFTISWLSPISSLLFCLVLMAYSMFYFSKKDY
jgi:ABC-type transport system involved in multi-copper enzyme maturation permease subunit